MSETCASSVCYDSARESIISQPATTAEWCDATSELWDAETTKIARINKHIILQDSAFILYLITSQRKRNINAISNICEAYIHADTLACLHRIRSQIAKTVCVIATKRNPHLKYRYDHITLQYGRDCEQLYTQLAAREYLHELDRELRINAATAVKSTIRFVKPGFTLSDTATVFQKICTSQGTHLELQHSEELTNLAADEYRLKVRAHRRLRNSDTASLHSYTLNQLPDSHGKFKRRRISQWVQRTNSFTS
ncbi:hypothetical protein SARC_09171 [Sphaeroforma arctica JP610]|uniref:Uncharacterized protein n=1 Tax=Sphaeroforma arctica JP610 TaxID=667725 RepID=A0A0L0FNK5_9EUKA|nr:hypothetical protein SARC_09171 [Sphaeroforma arctica JP610]KNC78392.1 hypothetical protein SARC_09171 [Sphaeroforma arctica JP610]|eukprot:XP_014152294.1 hypothetical protein SARC_09171 [Sphaeroforma arctica JP610]